MNKQNLSSSIIFIFSLFLMVSCTNEPVDPVLASQLAANNSSTSTGGETNTGGGSTTGSFTAKIDGENFIGQNTIATYTTTTFGNQFSITGLSNDGKSISIQILNPTMNTFQANFDISHLLVLQYQDIALGSNGMFSSYNSSSSTSVGSMSITSFDLVNKKFSATFNFTAFNSSNSTITKQVTTGIINNISFTDTTTTPPPVTNSVAGTYILTAFNTSVPTDLNNDGIPSTNQMSETNCYNNMLLTLNSDNTFVSNSKGVDIQTNGTTQTSTCYTDPDDTGTWSLNGNILTLTIASTPSDIQTFTVSGNTISATATNGQVVGYDTVTGAPAYLNCDITIIYTKQ